MLCPYGYTIKLAGVWLPWYDRSTMELISEVLQDPRKRRHALLIGITLITIPCYCAGWTLIQRAPSLLTPTGTSTTVPPSETSDDHTPLAPLESPTITQSPTITNTGFVPPSHTPSFTPEPSATVTITPFILDTETPTVTLTPNPTDPPTLTQQPTSTATTEPPTPTATDDGG